MKKGYFVLLALFMLFKPLLPVAEYVIYYDYIKNELCVNKDKPELQCNGKCHLAKELTRAMESDQGQQEKHFFSAEYWVLFNQDFLSFGRMDLNTFIRKSNIDFAYHIFYNFLSMSTMLKPPISI